jgi:Lrp/AsnC family leucine-responsive transcriptional regulator
MARIPKTSSKYRIYCGYLDIFRIKCVLGGTIRKIIGICLAERRMRPCPGALFGDNPGKVAKSQDEALMARLDETDCHLLSLLQEDDRQPLATLSEKMGIAISTINDRIKRLVRNGIISGFHARIAPEAVGLDLLAFIMVSWSNPKVEPAFLDKVKASADVLECHHITGAWNYLLKVRVGTTRDLERFLTDTIKAVGGVERTETLIALSTAKETWKVGIERPMPNSSKQVQ